MREDGTRLKRARSYDPAALAELYDQNAPKMYAYFYRRVNNAALAEDLTSELFLKMIFALQNGNAWRKTFHGWLYQVAHNLVVDHFRRQPPVPDVALNEGMAATGKGPAMLAEEAIANEALFDAIRQLTMDQRQVLALRFGEGLTARDTGQVMGKTPGSVEALQRRALAGLRRIMRRGVNDGVSRR